MLACASLGEKSIEGVVAAPNRFVAWHLSIRLNTVLQAKQLPASVTNLDASLAKVKAKSFTHGFLLDCGATERFLELALTTLTTEVNASQKRRTKSTA
jgi:hypothetical protein